MPSPAKVFISYSRRDASAREELLRFLRPMERDGLLDWWSDTRLAAGARWQEEIERALASATVAIFLVSQDFLASDFIAREEVQPLLARATEGGLIVIPVFLSPSSVAEVEFALPSSGRRVRLADLQGCGSPERTLAEMPWPERERAYTDLAHQLRAISQGGPSEPGPEFHPAPSAPARLARRIARLQRGRPTKIWLSLMGLLLGVPFALALVGFLAQRFREALLGIPDLHLSYPLEDRFATGADALLSLPWWALGALGAPHPVLRWSAAVLLLWTTGLTVLRWRRPRPAILLPALAVSAVTLTFGSAILAVVLADTGMGPVRCGTQLSATLLDRATFETCSWLMNESPRNEVRLQGLGGILGWLLGASLMGVWGGWTPVRAGSRTALAQRGLAGAHIMLLLFLCPFIPKAHALAEWGLRYPPVQIRADRSQCDAVLARAITSGACCAFDITAGADERTLFLLGRDCPNGKGAFLLGPRRSPASECLVTLPVTRGIFHGCS